MAEPRRTAVETALKALRHRDLSAAELERRLATRGFAEHDRSEALATLRRTGLIDDRRFAEGRAKALADRGAGDALIRHDLEHVGVGADLVSAAVGSLEPEAVRARRILERRGLGPRTARYLSGKGFSEETLAALVADDIVARRGHDELG